MSSLTSLRRAMMKSKEPSSPLGPLSPCSPLKPLGPLSPAGPVSPTGPRLHLQNWPLVPPPPLPAPAVRM